MRRLDRALFSATSWHPPSVRQISSADARSTKTRPWLGPPKTGPAADRSVTSLKIQSSVVWGYWTRFAAAQK